MNDFRSLFVLQTMGESWVPKNIPPVPSTPTSTRIDTPSTQQNPSSDLTELSRVILQCHQCQRRSSTNQPLPLQSHNQVKLVFVSESPFDNHHILSDEAASMVQKMATALKLTPNDWTITSLYRCFGQPHSSQISCLDHLFEELQMLQPKCIVLWGSHPMLKLTGKRNFFSARGALISSRFGPMLPTYHPHQLIQQPHLKADSWKDLQQIIPLLKK